MRNRKLLYAAAVCFIFLVMLINVNAQTGTPPLWLTHKYFKWSDGLLEYYVTGYWWTDGPYWHKGDVRTFRMTYDVYSSILAPNYWGKITNRLCILIMSEPYRNIVDGYQCNPSYEQFLPTIQMGK